MKKAKVISIWTAKGGVAKTTTTVHTAALLAERGYRVLLLDADFQRNSSMHYCIESNGRSLLEVLLGTVRIEDAIQNTEHENLDLLPASAEMEDAEEVLLGKGNYLLKDALQSVIDRYDYIIVDNNPCGPLHVRKNMIAAADGLVVPIALDEYSLDGLLDTINGVKKMQRASNRNLEIYGMLVTMHETRLLLKRSYIEILRECAENNDLRVFETVIHKSAAIPQAAATRLPIHKYDKRSRPAKEYSAFVDELLEVSK